MVAQDKRMIVEKSGVCLLTGVVQIKVEEPVNLNVSNVTHLKGCLDISGDALIIDEIGFKCSRNLAIDIQIKIESHFLEEKMTGAGRYDKDSVEYPIIILELTTSENRRLGKILHTSINFNISLTAKANGSITLVSIYPTENVITPSLHKMVSQYLENQGFHTAQQNEKEKYFDATFFAKLVTNEKLAMHKWLPFVEELGNTRNVILSNIKSVNNKGKLVSASLKIIDECHGYFDIPRKYRIRTVDEELAKLLVLEGRYVKTGKVSILNKKIAKLLDWRLTALLYALAIFLISMNSVMYFILAGCVVVLIFTVKSSWFNNYKENNQEQIEALQKNVANEDFEFEAKGIIPADYIDSIKTLLK
jgi:hypothetical protein